MGKIQSKGLEDMFHADETRVVIRLVDVPWDPPREGFAVFWLDDYVDLNEAPGIFAQMAASGVGEYPESYELRQSASRVEWGASASVLDFVLDVSSNLTADVILFALGVAIGRLRKRPAGLGSNHGDFGDVHDVTDGAMRSVEAIFKERLDSLKIDRVSISHTVGTITILGEHGQYEVSVGILAETGEKYFHARRI